MRSQFRLLCSLLILNVFSSYLLTSKTNVRPKDSKLYIVEHLADCVNNPSIAEAFGGIQSEFCYQPNGLSSNQLGTLFQQITSIGFMVATYFLFKRNGLAEFIDMSERDDDDNDEWVEMDSDGAIQNNRNINRSNYENMNRNTNTNNLNRNMNTNGMRNSNNYNMNRNGRNSIKCPQCGGLGEVKFGFEMNYCDLCDGTGRVPYNLKPSTPPRLPPSSS